MVEYCFLSDAPDNKTTNIALMSLLGFLIGGAANLISAAVYADLGEEKCLTLTALLFYSLNLGF